MNPESDPPLFKLSQQILLRPREWRFTGPGSDSPGDEPPSRYNQRRVCRCMTYKIFHRQIQNRVNKPQVKVNVEENNEDDNCSYVTTSCISEQEASVSLI